jgi:hypothetical protein
MSSLAADTGGFRCSSTCSLRSSIGSSTRTTSGALRPGRFVKSARPLSSCYLMQALRHGVTMQIHPRQADRIRDTAERGIARRSMAEVPAITTCQGRAPRVSPSRPDGCLADLRKSACRSQGNLSLATTFYKIIGSGHQASRLPSLPGSSDHRRDVRHGAQFHPGQPRPRGTFAVRDHHAFQRVERHGQQRGLSRGSGMGSLLMSRTSFWRGFGVADVSAQPGAAFYWTVWCRAYGGERAAQPPLWTSVTVHRERYR